MTMENLLSEMVWGDDNILKLISLYREQQVLWNQTIPDYKNKNMKNYAWTDISREMNLSKVEVQNKMRNLIIQFNREAKKGNKSGSGADDGKTSNKNSNQYPENQSRRKMMEVTLTWKDHHNNLCGMFEKLFKESVLVDCTLAAEGKYMNVHKAILSAVSPYFELLFTQESEKNPIVILTDIKFQEMKAMIDFIYRGKVNVPEEYLDDFLCAAESLQIKGLGRDYIKKHKRNGSAMTNAQEMPNHVSHIPLNQRQINVVSVSENCGTATPLSCKEINEGMDIAELSAVPSQKERLHLCRINPSFTSANVVDNSIPNRLADGECELNSTPISTSLCLETLTKCELTSEEEVVQMEFVECKEECVEEDASHCISLSETTCKSVSSSRLVTARRLQTDPLSSNVPNQSTSSVREFDKSDHDSLNPVSSQELQGKGKDFLYLSTLPSTSCIDKELEINTEDVMPRIVTAVSSFHSEIYTSETAGTEEGEVDVEEVKLELLSEEDVEKEGVPSLACVESWKVFGDASRLSEHARTHTAERSFACEVCGKAFQRPSSLKRHVRKHSGERPFACEVCGKAFAVSTKLSKHKRVHTGERPFACEVCGKAFQRPSSLKRHLRKHSGERPFACEVCGKAFAESTKLSKHKRTHTGERPFACEVCGMAFAESTKLSKHRHTHTGERPFACPTCGKAFSSATTLKTHLRIHTGERPFACDVCGRAFVDSSSLIKHKRTHTGERPFSCQLCDKAFKQTSALKTHLRTHTGEFSCACHLCGKAFKKTSNLKTHLRTHTGERPYRCRTCGKGFAQLHSLKGHLRTHTGERPFVCPTCGKAFAIGSNLSAHQRIHTGERPFACEVCGKDFHTKSYLILHLRTHTGERPYSCTTCGKAFSKGCTLKRHLRIHTGERPFACQVCGKDFQTKSHVILHLRTHTGERPFTCEVCGKDFQTKAYLILHLRTHTGERPFACSTCGKAFSQASALTKHQRSHARKLSSARINLCR